MDYLILLVIILNNLFWMVFVYIMTPKRGDGQKELQKDEVKIKIPRGVPEDEKKPVFDEITSVPLKDVYNSVVKPKGR